MSAILASALALSWLVGGWFGWQLLRQNGRLLLRLDEVEAWLADLQGRQSQMSRAQAESADELNRANRFAGRSLARSKIARNGLKPGMLAPDFCLPRVDGGNLSLQEFRGRRVLLVFSDPHCGPCNALAPELERLHREHPDLAVLMISRGEPEENRIKAREHRLTFPIILQQHWEVSRRYAMFAMPIAYLIDEAGVIANDVVAGRDSILKLMLEVRDLIHD